jgi:PAS domain S-box-containing protein
MNRDEHIRSELERQFRLWSVRAAPIGALIFLLLAPLDLISAPALAWRLLGCRVAAAAALLLVWRGTTRAQSPRALRLWVVAGVAVAAVAMETLILATGGLGSPYTIGVVLLAVTALGLIPASARLHLVLAGAIYGVFLVPLLLWGEALRPRAFFTENYLILATLGALVALRHLHRTSLTREIGLAHDLGEKERALETQVADRTAELLRAASEWRATFDSVADLMLLIDADGRVVRANLPTFAFFGREPREIVGAPAKTLLHRAELDGALLPFEIVQRTAARAAAEVRHAPSSRWFLATVEPIPAGRAQAGGSVFTLRDISEVKVMEQAVRDARDDWEETFDSIQEGITIHDANFFVLRANAEARRLLGCTEEELGRLRCHELFHGLPAPIGGCPCCESARTGRPTSVDLFEPHLGRYLEVTALPRPGGGVTHVVRDISERKLAMDELSRAADRLQRILWRAPFGVFIVNDALRVEFANPAMVAISGYRREQFIGAFLGDLAGCMELGITRYVEDALDGVPFRLGPAEFHCGGGRRVVGQFSGMPVDEDGQRKALVFAEDVTSLASAEEERQRLNALLLQAQKMESIGTLASGIAHDFNNVLLGVIGLTDAAAERLEPGHPARAELDAVIGAAERGSGLVQQLLAFGRKQELRVRRIDLRRLLEETRAILAHLLPKTVAIESGGTPPPPVVADLVQIGQVLMNLAVNARDAMPDGGTLSLTTGEATVAPKDPAHPGVPPGRYAVLTVRDTGTGMTPEVQARIFDPFFTTKEPGAGTGLGLATAYGIVSQHGGAVRVESAPGAGSTFFVYLPAAPEGAPGEPQAPPRGTETVLLVEDDPMARQVIGRRLAELGYRVLEASDGEEAVALLERGDPPPQLVLCDVVLPGLRARQVAAAARAKAPRARVVFMSGHPESQLAQRGLLAPGNLLVAKNLGPDEIARRLRAVLDREC